MTKARSVALPVFLGLPDPFFRSRFFSSCQRRHHLNISVLLMFKSFPTLYALLPHIIIPMAIPFIRSLCAITQKWRGKTAVFCTWHSERFSVSTRALLTKAVTPAALENWTRTNALQMESVHFFLSLSILHDEANRNRLLKKKNKEFANY